MTQKVVCYDKDTRRTSLAAKGCHSEGMEEAVHDHGTGLVVGVARGI